MFEKVALEKVALEKVELEKVALGCSSVLCRKKNEKRDDLFVILYSKTKIIWNQSSRVQK